MKPDQTIDQVALDALIHRDFGIAPVLFSPYALTEENEHKVVSDYEPESPNPAPTSKWITVLFFPNDPKSEGSTNRLRLLFGIERFYYAGRLRFAEVDLAQQGKVSQDPINKGESKPLPAVPELRLIDPDGSNKPIKYAVDMGQSTIDVTHAAPRHG